MAFVAGIDEAGFGPLLGPLVVAAAAVETPDGADGDLWNLLSGCVTRKPSRRPGTVPVADSKKLLHRKRPRPLEHLERGVLGFLATGGIRPGGLGELLDHLAPGLTDQLGHYPWYADDDLPLPRCHDATDLALTANALAAGLKAAGVRVAALRAEVLLAGEYNRIVETTHNKSTTLFDVSSRLLVELLRQGWAEPDARNVLVCCDRQGGRMRYRPGLQRVFDRCDFKVLEESETLSAYRMSHRRRQAELRFGVGFDARHLPVALASMIAKYVRELLMEQLNAFWARHVESLAPTAGYYADGKRFVAEIAPAAERLGIDPATFLRSR